METALFKASRVMRRAAGLVGLTALCAAGAAGQNPQGAEVQALHVQGKVYMLVGAGGNVTIQVGDDGVLVVDTQMEGASEKLIAKIREIAGKQPIRYIVNTHFHPDHVGGNAAVAIAGEQIVAGNFAAQVQMRTGGESRAFILAHENTLNHLVSPKEGKPMPQAAWPTDTFFNDRKDLYFNGEAVVLLHQPKAHTDGDIIVHFRGSDVVAAGDLYINTTYPFIDRANGGSINGLLDALNNILDITIPADKQEAGTYVVPGHGRLADEADVVEYRDMLTIIRDRIQDMIQKGMTLEQVKAARPTRDYDGRYGAETGFVTTQSFVEAVYASLRDKK